MTSFSSLDDFVVATFDVLGTGTTTVNLDVMYLGIGNKTSSDLKIAYLVDNSVVNDITSQSGFSNYTYSTNTVVNEGAATVRGDVDMNGKFQIGDITALQRYLAEFRRLSTIDAVAADANKDGKLDIRDVTQLARMLAGLA